MLPRNADLRVTQRNHLADIYSQLSKGDKDVARADAITLGDAYLHVAIQRGLLQPIDHLLDRRWWVRGVCVYHAGVRYIGMRICCESWLLMCVLVCDGIGVVYDV